MKGFRWLKIIGVAAAVIGIGMIQVSFSVIEINGVSPHLMLILVFGVSFFENKFDWKTGAGFSIALGGGLFLDLFSGLPLGTEALMLVGITLAVSQILRLLDKSNFLVYLVLFSFLLVVYQSVLSWLSFSSWAGLNWIVLVYNLVLAPLIYSCFLATNLSGK